MSNQDDKQKHKKRMEAQKAKVDERIAQATEERGILKRKINLRLRHGYPRGRTWSEGCGGAVCERNMALW